MGDTSIRVSEELADELYSRKGRGDTYEDVIWDLIDRADGDGSEGIADDGSRAPGGGEEEDDPEPVAQTSEEQGAHEAAEQALEDIHVPGRGELATKRREAILGLFDHLREHEGEVVPTRDLKELVAPDDVGYDTVESFWTNSLKGSGDRPNALTVLPGVTELGNGRYRYSGDADE